VRLAWVAARRTAFDDSVQLLVRLATLVTLVTTARRIASAPALDAWLAAALLWSLVLPAATASAAPLRSVRLALLPIPPATLRRARLVAGAPVRVLFATTTAVVGCAVGGRLVHAPAMVVLAAWACAAVVAGSLLDNRWHAPAAAFWRGAAALLAMLGAWSLQSMHGRPAGAGIPRLGVPAMLPRGDGAAAWLVAMSVAVVTFGVVVAWIRGGDTVTAMPRPRVGTRPTLTTSRAGVFAQLAGTWRQGVPAVESGHPTKRGDRLALGRLASGRVRPRVAVEFALLGRHVGAQVALACVALLGFAAAYGRVPALGVLAALPMVVLTGNALGADVPLHGLLRHHLLPQAPPWVRDRRLAVWALVTGVAGLFGALLGGALPSPPAAGHPPGGALAAPATIVVGAAFVPWFGRAAWWWARRYPQPAVQRWRDAGARQRAAGPAGPAHLAVVLLACWGGTALGAAALLALCTRVTQHPAVGGFSGSGFVFGLVMAAGVSVASFAALSRRTDRSAIPADTGATRESMS
jgi:hypothetical protein